MVTKEGGMNCTFRTWGSGQVSGKGKKKGNMVCGRG